METRENTKLVWPGSNDGYKKFVPPLNFETEEKQEKKTNGFENEKRRKERKKKKNREKWKKEEMLLSPHEKFSSRQWAFNFRSNFVFAPR